MLFVLSHDDFMGAAIFVVNLGCKQSGRVMWSLHSDSVSPRRAGVPAANNVQLSAALLLCQYDVDRSLSLAFRFIVSTPRVMA